MLDREKIIADFKSSPHLLKRMDERNISRETVEQTIREGKVAVLMDDRVSFTTSQYKLIASLTTQCLITVYKEKCLSRQKVKKIKGKRFTPLEQRKGMEKRLKTKKFKAKRGRYGKR